MSHVLRKNRGKLLQKTIRFFEKTFWCSSFPRLGKRQKKKCAERTIFTVHFLFLRKLYILRQCPGFVVRYVIRDHEVHFKYMTEYMHTKFGISECELLSTQKFVQPVRRQSALENSKQAQKFSFTLYTSYDNQSTISWFYIQF